MKLHHLLQKCSFFLIKPADFQAGGAACLRIKKRLGRLSIFTQLGTYLMLVGYFPVTLSL